LSSIEAFRKSASTISMGAAIATQDVNIGTWSRTTRLRKYASAQPQIELKIYSCSSSSAFLDRCLSAGWSKYLPFILWLELVQEIFVFKKRVRVLEKVRVGEVLTQKGLITKEQLAQALATQRQTQIKLGEVLIQQGLVTRQQLNHALTEQQRRNWTAAVLFALSAMIPVAPKLIAPNSAVIAINPSTVNQRSHLDGVGGATQLQWKNDSKPILQAYRMPNEKGFYVPLSDNPHPTIASPLTGFCHPLDGAGYLSQGIRGTTHQGRMEYAYDLATSIGTPVYAMRAGRVIGVQDRYPDTGGGAENISKFNYVLIEHDGGYRSAYLHLKQGFRGQVQIKAGDRIEIGQLIGYSGNSGWSSGPHLHVEVQEPGEAYSFGNTVPFAIAGACGPSTIARSTPPEQPQTEGLSQN
jgi:murein DD-endopeptidase MepM/ murein hydrolase activator NlpD